MTKQELINKKQQLQEELAAIEEKINRPQRWQDKLTKSMEWIVVHSVLNGIMPFSSVSLGVVTGKPEHSFSNEEDAELMAQQFRLNMEMSQFALVMNEGWKVNWKNDVQFKWGIIVENWPIITNLCADNYFIFGIAVKSREIAEQMLLEFGDRIEKYYGKTVERVKKTYNDLTDEQLVKLAKLALGEPGFKPDTISRIKGVAIILKSDSRIVAFDHSGAIGVAHLPLMQRTLRNLFTIVNQCIKWGLTMAKKNKKQLPPPTKEELEQQVKEFDEVFVRGDAVKLAVKLNLN